MKWLGFLLWFWLYVIHAGFYDRRFEGWHWYENLKDSSMDKEARASTNPDLSLKTYRQILEEAREKAFWQPTSENIRAYLAIQKDLFQKSERFARMWQQVLVQNPELDYERVFPTSDIGRNMWEQKRFETQLLTLKAYAKTHGLIYFFRSDCSYCDAMSSIVKQFSEHFHWPVVAVSLDGLGNDTYPHPTFNQGQAEKLQVKHVPALFAVNHNSQSIIPLAYGLVTMDTIIERLGLWVDLKKEKE